VERDRARALVIPFGVPDGGKGLGLGLASLVHAFARVDDGDIALAQLRSHASDGEVTGIVEAFVTAAQWRAMPGADETPANVSLVLTGAFEPPREGRGTLSVFAFDPKTGAPRAKHEAVLDADGVGKTIVSALETVCARVGGDASALRGLEPLGWDVLESVLMAETWRVRALSGVEPSGVVAALAHLGRAVSEARDATFPADRLATVALEIARGAPDAKSVETALRTVTTALADAPANPKLEGAAAALCLRLGRAAEAIAHAERAVELEPARAFVHALIAEAKRSSGDVSGAARAIESAAALDESDPYVRNERAALLLARGDAAGAEREWRKLLASQPLHAAAFANLASLALERGDAALAQWVVDHALAVRANAAVDVLRRAIQVAMQVEPPGLARGARLASLCRAITERSPKDGVAALLLARALGEMGETTAALEHLAGLERAAEGTLVAAEAARVRLHVSDPLAAAAVDAAIRAASEPDARDLEATAARARRLAVEHESWVARLAAAIAERRLGRLERARVDALAAIALAPSAPLAHVEMATLLLAMKDASGSIAHARRAAELDPTATRAHVLLAEALWATGDRDAALEAVGHALAVAPNDTHAAALRDRIEADKAKRSSWIDRLLRR